MRHWGRGEALDDLKTVLDYHDRTKHHFQRFARSMGYLDWANQPAPFRSFEGAERLPLDRVPGLDAVAYADLFRSGTLEAGPLTAGVVADFLRHSLAVSAWKQAGGAKWALRVNPSSGNLHPTEGSVVLPAVEGLADSPGVYHYRPQDHSLERRAVVAPEDFAALTAGLPEGSFLVGLTSIHWREAWKYGERAFRYCQHDMGHAIAALRLAAALSGRHVRVLTDCPHDLGAALLGTDRDEDFPVPAEREEFEALAVVSPSDPGQPVAPDREATSGSPPEIGRAARTG